MSCPCPTMIGGSRRAGRVGRALSAFTLLEVMLAIVIFSGVLAAIYSTWTSILRSSQVAQTAAAEIQRSRMAVRALEEALLGAEIPLPQATPASRLNAPYYSFFASGEAEEPFLSFVARLPDSFPRSGRFGEARIRRVTFNLERDWTGGNQLVLRQTPLLFEPDQDEEENPLVLAKNVQQFSLEFWDIQTEEWRTEWTETNRVPPLIRFALAAGRSTPGRIEPSSLTSRVVPMVGSGTLTGVRSTMLQGPGVEPVNPPLEPPQEQPQVP